MRSSLQFVFTAVVAFVEGSYAFSPSSPLASRPVHNIISTKASSTSDSDAESFEPLGLSNDLLEVTRRTGWEVPTPIQSLSIPAILEMDESDTSKSLWCEAPTGSGKTGAFTLPLLQILMDRNRPSTFKTAEGIVSTLILCPTRELAAQTGRVVQSLVSHLPKKHRNISVDVIHGGVPIEPQVTRLARRRKDGEIVDFLIATPGRLVDVLKHKDEKDDDPTLSALERRIMDAFDQKSEGRDEPGKKRRKGKRGRPAASSLSLHDIQEMDLDRVDDDGRGTMNEMLRQLDYLVLDEADRLLGGAFKEEMDELLSLFPQKGETELKTLLFSATFPEHVEERVDRILSRVSLGVPLRLSTSAAMMQRVQSDDDEDSFGEDTQLSNRQKKHIARTTPIQSVAKDTRPNIRHRAIRLNERDRTQALRHLLGENDEEWDRVLVFVGTRYTAEHVSRKLRRYDIRCQELHGKLDQDARERRLKSFRTGKCQVLVSTDLAARGIDVEGLPVVVNYDLPRSAADFTHRTGRTGRAGKSGESISFITPKKEAHFNFIEKRELQGETIEREVLPEFALDESAWEIDAMAGQMSVPGAKHSTKGLEHDRIFGGVKGRRKSKKDKLREAAAKAAQESA
ncbi:hypothetical protein ACHAWT_009651 [Skeletonema menzelii]